MAIFGVWFMVMIVCVAACSESNFMVYNTSGGIHPGKLNVHLVPHTHDDVGWLKTVDQYYLGLNNSIQGACVQNILDSIIPALLADKNRKFIYVEMAFLQRWWRQQSKAIKATFRDLVSSGRLELINGGICMHDEAATHYIDMIDQTTLGHKFIKEEFNVTPRIGWQIDPFGHAAVQAYLLGAEAGFDSFFFARIDYQDRAERKSKKNLEVIWRGSRSLGSSSQIFAGTFPENHYEPPNASFYFEANDEKTYEETIVVQDDVELTNFNVKERVNDFVAAAMTQANVTRTNHIMWTMGADFKYQYAHTWYRNMDKLIHYVNLDGRVNTFYSTPSIYTDAKHASSEMWPLKTDDYFPYADYQEAYWTGYFTSRPALKGYVRTLSGYLMAARQLELLKGRNNGKPNTDYLANALAIAQHHDAVSGTSRQHVADDYARRLAIGYKEAEDVFADSLASLVQSTTKFEQCTLLNISYCPPAEVDLSQGKKLVVVVYNSLGWNRTDVVRIPVTSNSVTVQDSTGTEIESQLLPVVNASMMLRRYATAYVGKSPSMKPLYWLAFTATVPPMGFNTYVISSKESTEKPDIADVQNGTVEVGPGLLKLVYNDGKLSQYVNGKMRAPLKQSYIYYSSLDGSQYNGTKDRVKFQGSGAYIFLPNGSYPLSSKSTNPMTVLRGLLYDEVHQTINSWIYQITRVYKDKEHAEIEFIVGPIPINDGVGKEVVTKVTSSIDNKKTFYTDSCGRDFLERIRDYRADWKLQVHQPVSGNYYPINLGMYMKDENTELSLLVDRSVGGGSIRDGELEMMLHRRLIHDDGRGVTEVLNETVCLSQDCNGLTIQGKYYLRIDPAGEGAKWRRTFGQEIYNPFLLAFSEQEADNEFQVPTFSAIDPSYSLPENVALITLQDLGDGKVLLRLAHLYEVGEDKDLSAMASVELKRLFPNKKIKAIKEMSLTANQEREEMEKKRLVWKVADSSTGQNKVTRGEPVDPNELVVKLAPMEIRTFTVTL